MGAILETVDATNASKVKGKDAKAAWDALKVAYNKQTPECQYQLFQDLATTHQSTKELLPAFHQWVEEAGDHFFNAFPSGTTAKDVINTLITFLSLSNVEESEENDAFVQALSIAGNLTRSGLTTAYHTKQIHQDTTARAKASGLGARAGKQQPKPSSSSAPKCSHCTRAHKSDDCWKTYPDKMPQWMKVKQEEQRKTKAAKAAASA